MAGVMIRRDRGGGRKGESKRKQERKVDGTTSLALMRAIQLPQCSSNTIPPSSTSNESSSTGAQVLLLCSCGFLNGSRWMEKNGEGEGSGWYRRV